MKPSIGRIVHVVFDGEPEAFPAIVTMIVEDTLIHATVFSTYREPVNSGPIEFECAHRKQKAFWRWPPRD